MFVTALTPQSYGQQVLRDWMIMKKNDRSPGQRQLDSVPHLTRRLNQSRAQLTTVGRINGCSRELSNGLFQVRVRVRLEPLSALNHLDQLSSVTRNT